MCVNGWHLTLPLSYCCTLHFLGGKLPMVILCWQSFKSEDNYLTFSVSEYLLLMHMCCVNVLTSVVCCSGREYSNCIASELFNWLYFFLNCWKYRKNEATYETFQVFILKNASWCLMQHCRQFAAIAALTLSTRYDQKLILSLVNLKVEYLGWLKARRLYWFKVKARLTVQILIRSLFCGELITNHHFAGQA